jgi:hypothetical protein
LVLCPPGCRDKLRGNEALPFEHLLVVKANEISDGLPRAMITKVGARAHSLGKGLNGSLETSFAMLRDNVRGIWSGLNAF